MDRFEFTQVDVFGEAPLGGNPLAVVHGADALDESRMQSFARWTQLSETTFVMAPSDEGADYRVRIFTPGAELPFAGHPTLGTCHAWLAAGGVPKTPGRVVQQCGVGLVPVRVEAASSAFAAPAVRVEPVEPETLAAVVRALGLDAGQVRDARWLDNGPRWLALRLDAGATVLGLEPDHAALKSLAKVGVVGPHPPGSDCAFEVRAFAAAVGITEDPVTGSLNASLAQWLMDEGVAPACYVAAQGTRLGRTGRVHLAREGDTLWVGGRSVTAVRGHAWL